MALNAGPIFTFNEAISFFVGVDTQAEIDELWEKLIAGGGSPSRCGWLKDKYGLSWQIIPNALGEMLSDTDPREVRPLHERDAADVQARCREAARGVQRRVARFVAGVFFAPPSSRRLSSRAFFRAASSLTAFFTALLFVAGFFVTAFRAFFGAGAFAEHVLQLVGFAQPVGDRRLHLVAMRDVDDVVQLRLRRLLDPLHLRRVAPSARGTCTTSSNFRFGRTKK